jgi:hypothetical protein
MKCKHIKYNCSGRIYDDIYTDANGVIIRCSNMRFVINAEAKAFPHVNG